MLSFPARYPNTPSVKIASKEAAGGGVFGRVYISKTLDAVDCAIAETLCKPRHHHTTALDIQHGALGVWGEYVSLYTIYSVAM